MHTCAQRLRAFLATDTNDCTNLRHEKKKLLKKNQDSCFAFHCCKMGEHEIGRRLLNWGRDQMAQRRQGEPARQNMQWCVQPGAPIGAFYGHSRAPVTSSVRHIGQGLGSGASVREAAGPRSRGSREHGWAVSARRIAPAQYMCASDALYRGCGSSGSMHRGSEMGGQCVLGSCMRSARSVVCCVDTGARLNGHL
jgi:hypothetical protein